MQVFVLFAGCYSSTYVEAVFSTQALADAYMADNEDPDHLVEEFEVDESAGLKSTRMWKAVIELETGALWAEDCEIAPAPPGGMQSSRFVPALIAQFEGKSTVSRRAAIKLAAEARQAHLRENPDALRRLKAEKEERRLAEIHRQQIIQSRMIEELEQDAAEGESPD